MAVSPGDPSHDDGRYPLRLRSQVRIPCERARGQLSSTAARPAKPARHDPQNRSLLDVLLCSGLAGGRHGSNHQVLPRAHSPCSRSRSPGSCAQAAYYAPGSVRVSMLKPRRERVR